MVRMQDSVENRRKTRKRNSEAALKEKNSEYIKRKTLLPSEYSSGKRKKGP